MKRSVWVYGVMAGLLIAAMRFVDYRFLIIEHSVEIYGAIVAALFAAIGIWLGLTLTKEKIVEKRIEIPVLIPAGPFVFNRAKADELTLTPREIEVLGLMAEGLSNKEMAERLFVSENTVKTHCSRVFEKLDAKRRTEAVRLGKSLGLIQR